MDMNVKTLELDDVKYISDYLEEVTPFKNPGKLIRSKLGLLVLKSLGIVPDNSYLKLLTAVELIHCASLLHDDVVDNSDFRRGDAALRNKEGNSISIIYGDKLLTVAVSKLLELEVPELISIFNRAIFDMCEGEILQQKSKFSFLSIDEYVEILRLKTGRLFSALFEGLCILSEGKVSDEFVLFGESFGIAFQINNDLKDLSGSRSDIKNGIYSAPVLYSGGEYITDEAIEKTLGLMDNYSKRAIVSLDSIAENEYKREIVRIIECLRK